MPSFPGQGEGPDIIVASFGHLEALYELELGKAVKIAHKLSQVIGQGVAPKAN